MRCTYCSGMGFSTMSPVFTSGHATFISLLLDATISVSSELADRVTTMPSVLSMATADTLPPSRTSTLMRWQLTTSHEAMAMSNTTRVRLQLSTMMLLHLPRISIVAPIQPKMYTVSRLSPMTTSAGPVWHSTSHLELSSWKNSLGGPLGVSVGRAVGAFLTTTGAGAVSLNSERQVCMSLVTVFKPAVMAPPLFRAPKRSALGTCGMLLAAGLLVPTAVPAVPAATGVGAAAAMSAGLYWPTSRPFLVLFQATPVVWWDFT
mmetsp:Transcript_28155/g.38709  ORF Transcript_28155/g.38709 Transcript_28155/m.38709 type:complete len:262 (+) Transcript_28155:892-1677(+)